MPPRPLSRRIILKAFQIGGLRRWSHWQEAWPHLSLERAEGSRPGVVRWKGQAVAPLLPVQALFDRIGEEVVIFGSGPSLRRQDLTSMPPASALLLNGALSLAPRLGGAMAVAIEDERFVWAHLPMIREHLPKAGIAILSPAVMRALMTLEPSLLEGCSILLFENLLRRYREARRPLDAVSDLIVRNGQVALSIDPAAGVVSCGTVAFGALQFVLAARPQRIGLAGIDLSNTHEPRFYEDGTPQPTAIGRKQDRILAHFALARDHAARQGTAFECYSPVSALLDLGIPYSDRLAGDQVTRTAVPTSTRS